MNDLKAYPVLEQWYKDNAGLVGSFDQGPLEWTAWRLIDCFSRSSGQLFNYWSVTFRRFLSDSPSSRDGFLKLRDFYSDRGLDIFELFSIWGHHAFEEKKEDEFLELMDFSARETRLVPFYFLTAWTAFNLDEIESCLTNCELAGSDHAPVMTLKGQAYLESAQAEHAKTAFLRAIEIDSKDSLALFQLAKTHWALREYSQAQEALDACQRLTGPTAENALFLAILSLEKSNAHRNLDRAWSAMKLFLHAYSDNIEFAEKMLLLSVERKNSEDARWLVEQIRWREFDHGAIASKAFTKVLKLFGALGWWDLSRNILDSLIKVNEDSNSREAR